MDFFLVPFLPPLPQQEIHFLQKKFQFLQISIFNVKHLVKEALPSASVKG